MGYSKREMYKGTSTTVNAHIMMETGRATSICDQSIRTKPLLMFMKIINSATQSVMWMEPLTWYKESLTMLWSRSHATSIMWTKLFNMQNQYHAQPLIFKTTIHDTKSLTCKNIDMWNHNMQTIIMQDYSDGNSDLWHESLTCKMMNMQSYVTK